MTASASLLTGAALLGFAVAAPLGPTGATAIRQGLARGATTALWIGYGAALTDLLYVTAVYLGLTPVLQHVTWLSPLLYAVGAVMLSRMGFGALRDAVQRAREAAMPSAEAGGSATPAGWWSSLILGISITVINPATITSWLSLGSAFVAANMVGLSPLIAVPALLCILAGSAAWFTILSLLVGLTRKAAARIPRLLSAVGALSGLILLGFAAIFAWQALRAVFGW
jgi:threonine/homoserine/homoserine lactone efflux protein